MSLSAQASWQLNILPHFYLHWHCGRCSAVPPQPCDHSAFHHLMQFKSQGKFKGGLRMHNSSPAGSDTENLQRRGPALSPLLLSLHFTFHKCTRCPSQLRAESLQCYILHHTPLGWVRVGCYQPRKVKHIHKEPLSLHSPCPNLTMPKNWVKISKPNSLINHSHTTI